MSPQPADAPATAPHEPAAAAAFADPQPPAVRRERSERVFHGDTFVDEFAWLADKENPETISYLEAQNAYTEALTAGQEDLRTGQTQPDPGVVALDIEQLVLQVEHPTALGEEVPPQGQPHRVGPGGPVERLGDGSPPVDDQRLEILGRHGQAADVERFGPVLIIGSAIDPAEH